MDPQSVNEEQQPRRYGRGRVSGVISPVASALAPILPTGGWRIYTISDHMPGFDRATWRLKIGGLVEQPVSLTYFGRSNGYCA